MKIIKAFSRGTVERAVAVLRNGGLVIFATETVYIAAVDATNPKAVKQLINYKNRPFGKPFSVGTTNLTMARKYVDMNKTALNLYKNFYPGPITIVSRSKHKVAPGIESELGTLGIFVTNHALTMAIIGKLGRPVTTTSANASYQPRPFSVEGLLKNLSEKQKGLIDLIVDSGKIPEKEASTVIDTTLDDPVVLRQGGIKLKDKVEVLSRNEENTQNIGKELWQKYENYLGKRPLIFALVGPMGAGKTQFTKGLGRAMGIKDEIVSPTFNLLLNYQLGSKTSRQLTHIDAWRFQSSSELESLGVEHTLKNKNSVLVIEWAEKVTDEIKKHDEDAIVIWVKIEYLPREASAKWGGKTDNLRLIGWGVI